MAGRVEYGEFVEAGGLWWATRAVWKDGEGKVTREVKLEVEEMEGDGFGDGSRSASPGGRRCSFCASRCPGWSGQEAAKDGKATFESELVLLQHFALSQQWERCDEHFARLKELAGGRPGMRWLEMRFWR